MLFFLYVRRLGSNLRKGRWGRGGGGGDEKGGGLSGKGCYEK